MTDTQMDQMETENEHPAEAVSEENLRKEEDGEAATRNEATDSAGSEVETEASGEGTPDGEKDGGRAPEKKGFFKKKEKKDKKDEQIEDLTDRLKRSMAEFENFRKRTEKEKAAMYEVGARSLIEKILPVVDNFERGMATLKEEEAHSPFAEGMDKIYKQLLTTLESMDVTVIEALGQEFNPDFHNAVMHVEDEEAGENVVVEEFQKGYLYRGSVVRHSMVKVAN